MRDIHQLEGNKRYVVNADDLLFEVRKQYPHATKEGSVGSWSFYDQKQLIAEAWLHRTKTGWWLRIKNAL